MSIQDEINFEIFLQSQIAENETEWFNNDLADTQEC